MSKQAPDRIIERETRRFCSDLSTPVILNGLD